MPAQYAIPATPRVTSPSPTPSDLSDSSRAYAGPVTWSSSARQRLTSPPPIAEDVTQDNDEGSGSDSSVENRARSRSRRSLSPSKQQSSRRSKPAALPLNGSATGTTKPSTSEASAKDKLLINGSLSPSPNGHLSPFDNVKGRWRDISRSPSPLGLIPLHNHYRSFIHRHEIPRKALHVSIGFLTLDLYRRGMQPLEITPWLFTALVPIASVDVLRHRYEPLNKVYIRCVGALMRETEVTTYNGVIWYLLGAYLVLRFFPKDVGVMGVLLLSFCDTAASTFGRLYGRYTPRIRKGKSLAGTVAAWGVGVITAAAFWGYIVPAVGTFPNDPEGSFMFSGSLNLLPSWISNYIGWSGFSERATDAGISVISGPLALGVMSVWTGIMAAGSELIDLFGWDDNLTIPVLSGLGIWGFLKVFGS